MQSLNPCSPSSQAVLTALLNNLPLFVFWKDTDSRYRGCNLAFANLLGFSSTEDLIGKTDFELDWLPQGHSPWFFRSGDKAAMEGKTVMNQEEILALPKRESILVSVNKCPLYDNSGNVIGVLATALDTTELKKTQFNLKTAEAQVACDEKAKKAFLANISHDIRTPFSGVIGITQVLENRAPPELKEYLRLIHESGQGLLTWFNQILEMLYLPADEGSAYTEHFSVAKLLESVVQMIKPASEEKSLSLSLNYKNIMPKKLFGDVLSIKKALLNLLSNAISFTHQGFIAVMVGGEAIDDKQFQLEIIVIDSGIGIALEDQSKIFESFSRLVPAYKTQRHAPGMGLAIVKKLMLHLGGSVTVESTLGEGSRFTLQFPLLYGQNQEALQ